MSLYRAAVIVALAGCAACGVEAGAKPPALQPPVVAPTPDPTPEPPPPTRERVIAEAAKLIGEKETHGSNRSPVIDRMNRLTGVPKGSPYCASFNAWIYTQANVPATGWPLSAWSPSWVSRPTWTRSKGGPTPRAGDAFGLYFRNLKRVAHTGLVKEWGSGAAMITIEANTSPNAAVGSGSDRDGDGIWSKRRLKSQIHSTRDWIGEN